MIQCALNGSWTRDDHPGDGRETLAAAAHDAAVRAAAPGLELSCSTQQDIDLGAAGDRAAGNAAQVLDTAARLAG